jgi:lysophospholipase L1-like esterase
MTEDSANAPLMAFVGDSLTEGGDWQDWFPNYRTQNFGVGGNTTDDLLARLSTVIDAQPDTVVLLIGTNDLAWRHTAEHVVRNIEMVLVELRRGLPEARLLVQSVMPREAEFVERITEINRHLRQFAPTVYAQYLDLWPTMAVENGELNPSFSDDRLHLNDSGYDAWLGELKPAIERLLELPPTSRSITIIRDEYSRPPRQQPLTPTEPSTAPQRHTD